MKQRFLNQKFGKRNSRRAQINKAEPPADQTSAANISKEKLTADFGIVSIGPTLSTPCP